MLQFCLDYHILKLLSNIFIWCTKVGTHILPGVMYKKVYKGEHQFLINFHRLT